MLTLSELNVQYVTDESGEKNAVILPIEEFRQLVEDLNDLAVSAERVDEPTISHQQLIDELKTDDRLPD
jgi:PHD/YefM family antitoxin component YafN of YafNO toxin-antitoxin module